MSDKVTEVLEKAIDVLNERGWCQGVLRNADGALCAMGALDAAFTLGGIIRDYRETVPLEAEAIERMSNAAGLPCKEVNGWVDHSIPHWNDQPGRTVEDVILMFKQAAHDGSSE